MFKKIEATGRASSCCLAATFSRQAAQGRNPETSSWSMRRLTGHPTSLGGFWKILETRTMHHVFGRNWVSNAFQLFHKHQNIYKASSTPPLIWY